MMVDPGTALTILKDLMPFVSNILKQTDDSAFDVWRQTPVRRLEQLQLEVQALTNEYPELHSKLTENEKHSPISGVKKAFYEYTFAVDDNKLTYLRNALLNGTYGDYNLEIREHFYKIVSDIQPLDVIILEHLINQCSDIQTYMEDYRGNKGNWHIPEALNLYKINLDSNEKTIQDTFFHKSVGELGTSLDRLRNLGLVVPPDIGHFDVWPPYSQNIPTDIAQSFLNFLNDPRNKPKNAKHI